MTTAPSLKRNHDFTRFWFGETISLFGVQVTALALPLTAVLVLGVGPEQMGVLRFAAFIPFLFLALPFGVLADRRPKRPLMIGANLARAALIGLVPLLAVLDMLTVPGLVVIALGVGVCTVLFEVCWLSYVPVIVTPNHLVDANGRVATSSSAAEFAGPGVGGVFVQLFTAPYALVANSVSYLVSVVSLWFIRAPEPIREPSGRHIGKEIVQGIAFVARQPYLRVIVVMGAAFNFCYMFVEALFLIYAVRELHLGPGLIGLIVSLGAAGGLLGAAVASGLVKRMPFGRVFLVSVMIGYCGPLLIPAASGSTAAVVVMVTAGFVLMRAGLAVSNVAGTSLRQAVTPLELMGRMTAGMRTLMWGLGATGALAGGLIGGALGLRQGLWIAGVGFVLSALPLVLSKIPQLRALPQLHLEEARPHDAQ